MPLDAPRTLRGALAGTTAAAVWVLQQPLDKRAFGVDYDDVELLGRAITSGPGWRPLGTALHLVNGALFGAVYANVAPLVPLPPPARGPLAALVEHLATWPLTRLSDRVHPARDALPDLADNPRAFWQATWRHVLFGVVLGEVERRLNAGGDTPPVEFDVTVSTNGHGSLEDAVLARPTTS